MVMVYIWLNRMTIHKRQQCHLPRNRIMVAVDITPLHEAFHNRMLLVYLWNSLYQYMT